MISTRDRRQRRRLFALRFIGARIERRSIDVRLDTATDMQRYGAAHDAQQIDDLGGGHMHDGLIVNLGRSRREEVRRSNANALSWSAEMYRFINPIQDKLRVKYKSTNTFSRLTNILKSAHVSPA